MAHDVGQGIEFRSAFTALDGVTPTDPTTITLMVRNPAATITTYTYAAAQLTRVSVGVYTKAITLDMAGVWAHRFVGTGAVVAAKEALTVVRASSFV